MVFLVTRLIFGEFAHAMPHASMPMADEVVLTDKASPPCPDHAQETPAPRAAPESDGVSSIDHPVTDKDCCKKGGCACPCLHTPAAIAASGATLAPSPERRPRAFAPGAALLRSSALFRPPAALR
jgi:hypothetical protein